MSSNIPLALVQFPVYNKGGEIVVSSVTTLDLHDISRTCRTYGVESFYLITPLETQQRLVRRIVDHWVTGHGAEYNPTRKEALVRTRVGISLQDVLDDIRERTGQDAKTLITDAKTFPQSIGYERMRAVLGESGQFLLVFGTGWGLEKRIVQDADYVLAPIEGVNGFNHLPVRGAIAIILDRLFGRDPRRNQ